MSVQNQKSIVASIAAVVALLLSMAPAYAVPSFARQTGVQCAACHTVFPELTSFGRQFKLRGYTLGAALEKAEFPYSLPLSASAVMARNSTKNTGGHDDEFPRDRDVYLQTAAVYYGGKIAGNLGALVQYNYDGVERKTAIEMADIRFAGSATLGKQELLYGITANNNPTLSDIYNATPMWSFPHLMAENAVMPNAATLLDNTLFRQVGGVGVYGFWNNLIYGELAAYRTAKRGVFRPFKSGIEVENVVDGYAPYWRLALQREWGSNFLMVGTYGMRADLFPDASAPSGATDRFRDIAFDAQYHYTVGDHMISAHATHIREKQTWNASFPLGMTSNASDTLTTTRADIHYFFRRQWGGGIQYFSTRGDVDDMKYNMGEPVMGSITGSPDTRGWTADLNYLPWQNVKLGVRYTYYNKFNGAKTDYDGFGRNAKDNNTTFLYAWILF